jgi:hypothetical protein
MISGQNPSGLIEDRRPEPPGYYDRQRALGDLMSKIMYRARQAGLPSQGPAAPGSLAGQAGYNQIGQNVGPPQPATFDERFGPGVPTSLMGTEGPALVEKYLKAMHKSPVVQNNPSSGGFGNY